MASTVLVKLPTVPFPQVRKLYHAFCLLNARECSLLQLYKLLLGKKIIPKYNAINREK